MAKPIQTKGRETLIDDLSKLGVQFTEHQSAAVGDEVSAH